MEHPRNLIAELDEDEETEPDFPVLCPQCGEPMWVHCLEAWCVFEGCTASSFEWRVNQWLETEDPRTADQALAPIRDHLGL